jgi:RNA polymerase subunit RPABC4/transcription elongation factor Spt4
MKFCKNCGKQLKDDAKFCPNCGSVVSTREKREVFEKNEVANAPPLSDSAKSPFKTFCKNCGASLKEGAKFCPKCGSPVGASVKYDINQQNEELYNAAAVSDKPDKIKPFQTVSDEKDKIKPSRAGNNLADKDNASKNGIKNVYPRSNEPKVHKNRILPLLYGIIPVLIVAGLAVFLYKTNRLPFINRTSTAAKQASLNKKKKSPSKKIASEKNKEKAKTSKTVSAKKSKTKPAKNAVAYVYPKKPPQSPAYPSYVPSQVKTYRQPVYHVNHSRIAFDTFRTNFNSAGAKLISFAPEHVSGESGISFVILSHVYSFALNISPNSTEYFKVEFTAAVPQNINVSQVKIISKVYGQGISAENISYVNLSSSGVYTVEIPVEIPQYFKTGSYYFNANAEAPGMELISSNAYFRVE